MNASEKVFSRHRRGYQIHIGKPDYAIAMIDMEQVGAQKQWIHAKQHEQRKQYDF